jgi:hypothetical protein
VDMKLIMAFAISPTLGDARINAPSLQRVTFPLIRPIEQNLTPPGDPNVMWGRIAENILPAGEPVGADAFVNGSSSPEPQIFSFLWFVHKELRPIPHGDAFWVSYQVIRPLGAGSESGPTSFQWSPLQIRFDPVQLPFGLPSGTYAVIGFEHHGPSAIAARLVFPGSPFRPGTVATVDSGERTFDRFYDGSLGTYGIFRTTAEPSVEVVISGSDTFDQHSGHLRVVRVGGLNSNFHPHLLHEKVEEHGSEKAHPAPESKAASPEEAVHVAEHQRAATPYGQKEPGM